MNPDNSAITAKNIEVPNTSGENSQNTPIASGVEAPVPETRVDNAPSVPINDDDVTSSHSQIDVTLNAVQDASVADDQAASVSNVTSNDVFDDTVALEGDNQFIGQVKRIIREDGDEPFVEEEASESLQKQYLEDRFGVNILVDKEN